MEDLFDAKELLHLVFANNSDLYYTKGLLELSLDEFLWFRLHSEGYDPVYFLQSGSPECSVRTFGDQNAKPYAERQNPFRKGISWFAGETETDRFGSWMIKQLQDGAAFVFPMDMMCAEKAAPDWINPLKQIASMKGRRGILVMKVPTEVELSRDALLNSAIFDALGETGITNLRRDPEGSLCAALLEAKDRGCHFWSLYTKERIEALLLRLQFDHPDLDAAPRELELMVDYLLQYLNNPRLRLHDPLFQLEYVGILPEYCEVYRWLGDKKTWAHLRACAGQVNDAGGVHALLRQKGIPAVEPDRNRFAVSHGENTFARMCLKIRMDGGLQKQLGPEREPAADILLELFQLLNEPKSHADNVRVGEKLQLLCVEAGAAKARQDPDAYWKIVFVMRFYAKWIHVEDGGKEEAELLRIAEQAEGCVEDSKKLFRVKKALLGMQALKSSIPVYQAQMEMLENTINVLNQAAPLSWELLLTRMALLTSMGAGDSLQADIGTFQKKIVRLEKELMELSAPKGEDELQPPSVHESEDGPRPPRTSDDDGDGDPPVRIYDPGVPDI